MIRRTQAQCREVGPPSVRSEDAFAVLAPRRMEPISVRISDAIRLTGIGRTKIYELIGTGEIETRKVGRCTLIPTASLRDLLDRAESS